MNLVAMVSFVEFIYTMGAFRWKVNLCDFTITEIKAFSECLISLLVLKKCKIKENFLVSINNGTISCSIYKVTTVLDFSVDL